VAFSTHATAKTKQKGGGKRKMDIDAAITSYLTLNCDYTDSFYNFVLAISLFVPLALTFIFFGISYYTREIYYLSLSFALTFDYIVNFFYTGLYQDPAPRPSCGGSRAYPSFITQHSMFLFTFLILSKQLYFLRLERHALVLLLAWVLTTWIAAIRLGYNSLEQAIIGAFIGQASALVAINALTVCIYFSKTVLLQHDLIRRFYYVDNIFKLHEQRMVTLEGLKKAIKDLQLAPAAVTGIWDRLPQ
jgi:hypothetical protein